MIDNIEKTRAVSRPFEPIRRTVGFALFTLAGIAGDVWCGLNHVCREGHLAHPESQPVRLLAYDFVWITCFVVATFCVLRSKVPGRVVAFGTLLFLLFSRFLMGSGGGLLFLFVEFPMLGFLGFQSICGIVRVLRQRPETERQKFC